MLPRSDLRGSRATDRPISLGHERSKKRNSTIGRQRVQPRVKVRLGTFSGSCHGRRSIRERLNVSSRHAALSAPEASSCVDRKRLAYIGLGNSKLARNQRWFDARFKCSTHGIGLAPRQRDRGVLLVFAAPCQLRLLAGPEHGRTIPLADFSRAKFPHCSEPLTRSSTRRYAVRDSVASGNGCRSCLRPGRSISWAMFRPDPAISFLRCAPDVSSGEI
jgi:hypothetical protein